MNPLRSQWLREMKDAVRCDVEPFQFTPEFEPNHFFQRLRVFESSQNGGMPGKHASGHDVAISCETPGPERLIAPPSSHLAMDSMGNHRVSSASRSDRTPAQALARNVS